MKQTEKRPKQWKMRTFLNIMQTLECLEMTAADVLDAVAIARAEIKQTYEKIKQEYKQGVSA